MTGREVLAKIRKVMGGGSIEEFLENEIADLFDDANTLVANFEDDGEEFSEEGHAECIQFLKAFTTGLREDGREEVDEGKH